MNGSDHFKEAERLLAQARPNGGEEAARKVATAQVHATLALVWATLELKPPKPPTGDSTSSVPLIVPPPKL